MYINVSATLPNEPIYFVLYCSNTSSTYRSTCFP